VSCNPDERRHLSTLDLLDGRSDGAKLTACRKKCAFLSAPRPEVKAAIATRAGI
jgi:hypothetical protein